MVRGHRDWLVITAVVISGSASLASAADWPQWRGPLRDGKSSETGLRENWKSDPPTHLWTVEGMGRGYASLAIVDGRVYTTGNTDGKQCLICADALTGERLWATPLTDREPEHGYDGSRSTPTIDGQGAYVVTSDGQLCCVNIEDGAVIWKKNFQEYGGRMHSGWGFSESPLVDGDKVVCTPGGDGAMLAAFDKLTGEEVWRSAMPHIGDAGGDGAAYSSIVVSEGAGVRQYVQVVGRGVIGVRAEDGKFLWGYNKVANGTANIPTPLVSGDYVFASTGYGAGAGLVKLSRDGDGVSAEEQYFLSGNTFQNHHGGMVMVGDYVYAGHNHGQGFPICLNWKSGKVKWGGKIRPVGGGSAAITLVGENILFRYQDGVIALIGATPKGYELHGSFEPEYQEGDSWSHPVVVDGKLYLREQDKLMCYDVSKP